MPIPWTSKKYEKYKKYEAKKNYDLVNIQK